MRKRPRTRRYPAIPLTQPRVILRFERAHAHSELSVEHPLLIWALLALVVLAVLAPSRVWIVLLTGLGLTLGLCFGWALAGARGVWLERRLLHTWVQVGDLLEEVFILHNDSVLPQTAVEIVDRSDVPGYDLSAVRSAPGHGKAQWRQNGRSQRRGLYHLGPTSLRFSDPLGIFAVTVEHPAVREVLVFPPILHDLPVPRHTGGGQGVVTSRLRSLQDAAAIGGLRDYRPGDPIRRIHWPRSVRHQTYLVKEFDQEMGGELWLVLDLDAPVQAGQGDDSTVEYGVIWAASWAWHLMSQGRGVGLLAYGPERLMIPPAAGSGHVWALLRALATIQAARPIPLESVLDDLQPRLGRGDSVLVLTPSTLPQWPERLIRPGLRAAVKGVILFDALSFGKPQPRERPGSTDAVHALLVSLGIPTQVVRCQPDLLARPAMPGSGDWDFAVTPLGGVVVRTRPAEVRS